MTETTAPAPSQTGDAEVRAGLIAAAGAYFIWGILPIYMHIVSFADVREVLGLRILWSIPAAIAALFLVRGWKQSWADLRVAFRPRMIGALTGSAIFIFFNWGAYLWLVMHERVIEASLAYFLAPLVSVAVGVTFFKERISSAQLIALVIALAGVIVQGFALGAPPWISLFICATWSVYGVIRKRAPVQASAGMLVETLALAPVAVGLIVWAAAIKPLYFGSSWDTSLLLALSGPATATPLMLFAFAARRVSFTALGLLQYLAPTLQFFTGLAFGESFTPLRAASFALIWVGLALFSWDTVRKARAA